MIQPALIITNQRTYVGVYRGCYSLSRNTIRNTFRFNFGRPQEPIRYVFMLNGGPISWESSKQSCVALSSNEAEYVALSEATREATWLRSLVCDLNLHDAAPIPICGPSVSRVLMCLVHEHKPMPCRSRLRMVWSSEFNITRSGPFQWKGELNYITLEWMHWDRIYRYMISWPRFAASISI